MRYILNYAALIAFCIASFVLTGCVGPQLTVPEIVEMSEVGGSDQEICNKIEESSSIYRLKASQIAKLSEIGVSDQVIDCMQQTYIEAVRKDQQMEDWNNWTMDNDGYWYW